MSKPTIIFTTRILEYPPIGGPRLRILNSIMALNRVAELIIHSRASFEQIGGQEAVDYLRKFARDFVFSPSADPTKKLMGISSVMADFRDLKSLAARHKSKIIWLGYGNISYGLALLLKLFTNLKVVVDTDSVWSRFVLRSLPYQHGIKNKLRTWYQGAKKRIQESLGTKLADVTTAVSEVDASYYRALTRQPNKIAVFSNVINLESYKNMPENPGIKHPAVYLSGSFGPGSAMEEAGIWTIEKVLPIVWKKNPNLYFYIVGRGPTEKMYKLQNEKIIITGKVASVLPYLYHVDAVLVPLHFESGTRFKILEAAACGIPVVSTKLGAEGLAVRPEENILLADSPEEFATCIIRLIENPELGRRLAENAKRQIAQQYNIDRAVMEATKIIKTLQNG